MSKQPTPAGFGAPFWALRIVQHIGRHRSCDGCHEDVARELEPIVEELIAQTRLDEALRCDRALQGAGVLVPAPVLTRIAEHRRDLRAAKRRGK